MVRSSVVLDFVTPADAFLLSETLASIPGLAVEAEPFVLSESELFPYLWVREPADVSFLAAASTESDVREVRCLVDAGSRALYRTRWHVPDEGLVDAIRTEAGAVLQASGRGAEWELKLRFDSQSAISSFSTKCRDAGVRMDVTRMDTEEAPRASQFSLTSRQREALVAAFEMGYFDVPRTTTAREVAETLDISGSAFSQRLRRAMTNLVSNALTIGEPTMIGYEDG